MYHCYSRNYCLIYTIYPLIANFFNVLHLLLSTVNNPTSVSLFCINSVYMLSYICYIHIILYFLHILYVLSNCILKQTVKQPVNVTSKSINATIVHDCNFFNENCTNSQTNPLTTMHYFNTPTTNITAMPAIAHHDLPYSNLTDECFTNELTQENTTDS